MGCGNNNYCHISFVSCYFICLVNCYRYLYYKKKNAIETYGSFICGGSTKNKNKLSDITTQDKVIVGSCDMLGKTVEKGIELPVGIPDSNF